MMDDGTATICKLVDIKEEGMMPRPVLRPVAVTMYENRIIGYNRMYAAKGVNQEISALIRIWDEPVQIGDYIVISGSDMDGQYRVDFMQPLRNYDGLRIKDLTLARVENNYDVEKNDDCAGEIEEDT